jgi:dihydroorotase
MIATRRLIALARITGRRIHILHVSTAEELDYLKDHKNRVSVEVLANHLTQIAPDCYERKRGYAVMNPPIRDRRHYNACWQAIRDGVVDTIGSDHSPHSRGAKERPWPECSAGLTGVQTLVPLMLDHVNAGRLPLTRLVDLMSAGPARIYGVIGKGRLAVGYDADFTLVDLQRRRTIENGWIVSPCGWTPFDGVEVKGWPIATIIRGDTVMFDDEIIGAPQGRLARFQ